MRIPNLIFLTIFFLLFSTIASVTRASMASDALANGIAIGGSPGTIAFVIYPDGSKIITSVDSSSQVTVKLVEPTPSSQVSQMLSYGYTVGGGGVSLPGGTGTYGTGPAGMEVGKYFGGNPIPVPYNYLAAGIGGTDGSKVWVETQSISGGYYMETRVKYSPPQPSQQPSPPPSPPPPPPVYSPPPNLSPTASFSCDSSYCSGGSSLNCLMYQPTSDINPCIFTLRNNSTDPDGTISQTKWYIKKKTEPDSSFREIGSCSGKCDHTIQKNDVWQGADIYTVKLSVQDNRGASASSVRDLTVKREISAEFKCSLDNSNWESCESIAIFQGQTIFVKDYSSPSEGAVINSRIWQRGDGTNFETFAQNTTNASTTLTTQKKIIRLTVSDTASRSDYQNYQVSVTYPLPFWKEILPPIFFKMREFFAALFSTLLYQK
jgi:hypothetical protein